MATTFKQDCEELDLAYDDNFMYEAKKCWFDNGVDWIVEDLIEPNLEEIDALLETLEEGEEYDLTDAEDLEDVLAGFDESIEALTNIAQELRQYNYAA
jgi:hypothetical protein